MPRVTQVRHIYCEITNNRQYRTLTIEIDCFLFEVGIAVAVKFRFKRLTCKFCCDLIGCL